LIFILLAEEEILPGVGSSTYGIFYVRIFSQERLLEIQLHV